VARPPLVSGTTGSPDVDPRHDPVRLFVPPQALRRQIGRLQARVTASCHGRLRALVATGAELDGICG
jgi:hypothetical protein